jgi:hypothetical protein
MDGCSLEYRLGQVCPYRRSLQLKGRGLQLPDDEAHARLSIHCILVCLIEPLGQLAPRRAPLQRQHNLGDFLACRPSSASSATCSALPTSPRLRWTLRSSSSKCGPQIVAQTVEAEPASERHLLQRRLCPLQVLLSVRDGPCTSALASHGLPLSYCSRAKSLLSDLGADFKVRPRA